jgi:hypothetical protein
VAVFEREEKVVAVADHPLSAVSWGADFHDQRFGSGAVYIHSLLSKEINGTSLVE